MKSGPELLKRVSQMATFWPQIYIKYIKYIFSPDHSGEAYDAPQTPSRIGRRTPLHTPLDAFGVAL